MNFNHFILIFIYIIKYILTNNDCVILNFQKYYNNSKTPLNNLFDISLKTEISIGTPSQKIYVNLVLGNEFFVISSLNLNNMYNKELSQSYSISNNSTFCFFYRGKPFDSILSNENFNINNNNKQININFLYSNISYNYSDNFVGYIGLKQFTPINQNSSNFIYELKKNDYINSYNFFINYEENCEKGKIYIGKYPHEIFSNYNGNNYVWIAHSNVDSNTGYGYDNVEITYLNLNDSYYKITFDFNIKGIIGSDEYKNFINDYFFNKLFEENKCQIDYVDIESIAYNQMVYVCDKNINIEKFPNLNIYIKKINLNFTFNNKDLFIENNNHLIFLIFFNSFEIYQWRLGEIFFKKYLVIFDQDKKTIGFYMQKKSPNEINYKKIIIIIFLIICIVILIYILIKNIFYGKNNKKKAIELETGLNYNKFGLN